MTPPSPFFSFYPHSLVISTERSDERSQKNHIEISHTRFDMTNRKGKNSFPL